MERHYFVYIVTNRHHTVLYTGATKITLVITMNPNWHDLYQTLL
jgi:hypothetical protein